MKSFISIAKQAGPYVYSTLALLLLYGILRTSQDACLEKITEHDNGLKVLSEKIELAEEFANSDRKMINANSEMASATARHLSEVRGFLKDDIASHAEQIGSLEKKLSDATATAIKAYGGTLGHNVSIEVLEDRVDRVVNGLMYQQEIGKIPHDIYDNPALRQVELERLRKKYKIDD